MARLAGLKGLLVPRSGLETTLIAIVRCLQGGLVIVGVLLIVAVSGGFGALARPGPTLTTDHVALDILPVKPGGPAEDHAAYLPTTSLRVPAYRLITVTIRNFDLDAVPLPADSPYLQVQGTADGAASVDGIAYTALDRRNIAHTFTLPALHLNVPIPGQALGPHATHGARYVTVTFRVRTGAAGAFAWRCFAPCGDGRDGDGGAMAAVGYMRGTLFVEP